MQVGGDLSRFEDIRTIINRFTSIDSQPDSGAPTLAKHFYGNSDYSYDDYYYDDSDYWNQDQYWNEQQYWNDQYTDDYDYDYDYEQSEDTFYGKG